LTHQQVLGLRDSIFASLQKLQTMYGVKVTDDQLMERAANIATGLAGDFDMRPWGNVKVPEGMEAHAKRIIT
jgi:hypothetical protein